MWFDIVKNDDPYWLAALLFHSEIIIESKKIPAYNYPMMLLDEEITKEEFKKYLEHLASLNKDDMKGTEEYYMIEPAKKALKSLGE